MKILAIGDPHGNVEELKKIDYSGVDVILLPGDVGNADLIRKMAYTNIDRRKQGLPEIEYSEKEQKKGFMSVYDTSVEVVKYLSSKAPVYLVFGNVELSNVKTEKQAKKDGKKIPFLADDLNAMDNIHVIDDEVVEFKGIKIAGLKYFIDSTWIERFMSEDDVDYEDRMSSAIEDTNGAREALDSFGEVDILISHQPPFEILDVVTNTRAPRHWQGMHAGSKLVLEYVKNKKPKYVLCGHIHEGEGDDKVGNSVVYNLGSCGYRFIEI
jgi:Icc-related predicted phosphoesterase